MKNLIEDLMRPSDFDVHKLVEELQGTCQDIPSFLPEGMSYDDLTKEDLQHIDNELFECQQCGWWCEMSEHHESTSGENGKCDDCFGEGNEEE